MSSLRQVHFCAEGEGEWYIDHNIIRNNLARLPCIKKVAFSLDTYKPCYYNDFDPSSGESYYEQPYLYGEDFAQRFEIAHCEDMLKEARNYAAMMPKLEWVYFGQILMAVEAFIPYGRKVRPLTKQRDKCWTLLRETFKWKDVFPD